MAEKIILTTFRFRRGLAAAWTANNPVLDPGEPGLETDTLYAKFGDGTTAWNDLDYAIKLPDIIEAIAALTLTNGDVIYATGASTVSTFASTTFGRSLVGAASAAVARALLDVPSVGTVNAQLAALDSDITALESAVSSINSSISSINSSLSGIGTTLADHESRIAALEP